MRDIAISVAAAAAGAAVVVAGLRLLPGQFTRPPHLRANFRGRPVIGTAGIVLVLPLSVGLLAAAMRSLSRTEVALWGSGLALAMLGYLDDLYGSRRAGGFAGHLRELAQGHVTTGLVKAVGGGIVGLAAAWYIGRRGWWIAVAGAVIALSANLANLFDVRPGRAIKLWVPVAAALVVVGLPVDGELVLLGLGGGVLVFFADELRERVMLGDTGAGLLGSVAGGAAVTTAEGAALVIVLAALLGLTAAAEVVSFSRVIEAVPALRWADRLGRQPE